MKRLTTAINAIGSFKTKHFAAILVVGALAIIASCGGGGSGTAASLSPPSNVKVARSSTKDTVSWTAAASAVKYKVYATASSSTARTASGSADSQGQAQDNANCACSWQSMTCASDVAAGSSCKYCETTNTCADFDHAPADINESYQVSGIDQSGKESAKSEKATNNSGSSSGGSSTSSSGGSSSSSGGASSSGSGGSTALPPGMSLACVGVEHGTGVSYIHVCVNMTNVPGASWPDFTAAMGSAPSEGYTYTYNSELQTYLIKACATFTIHQYGTYSGVAGITTDGGSAALTWDINVTSAPVACQ